MTTSYVVIHRAVRVGEPFDMEPSWAIIDAEFDHPLIYLVILCPAATAPPDADD